VQTPAPRLGQFVELKFGDGRKLGDQQTVAGAWLEHDIGGRRLCEQRDQGGHVDRRRKCCQLI
jgi:hypothetical protein